MSARYAVDLTKVAAAAWELVFERPWPARWRVLYTSSFWTTLGETDFARRTIKISRKERSPFRTLAHEFVHLRWPRLRHGREFERRSAAICAVLGLRPSVAWLKRPESLSARELLARLSAIEDAAEEVREALSELPARKVLRLRAGRARLRSAA